MTSLVIFGSRDAFPTFDQIEYGIGLLGLEIMNVDQVISGKAIGADWHGELWANRRGIEIIERPILQEDWNRLGKKAGSARNRQMAIIATHGIGFWHKESGGTANMTAHMAVFGKPCRLVEWKKI